MDETLSTIYYSTKNGRGSISAAQLFKQAKKLLPQLTLKATKEFVASQEGTQIFKGTRKDLFNPIVAPDHTYQCDLLFFQERGKLNAIFVMMEITTRMAYLRLLKDKTASSCAAALNSILKEEKPIIKAIEHDDGGEFKGEFNELCLNKGITNISFPRQENSKTSLGKVERLNRSIRQWWNKSYRGQQSLASAIPELQDFYNNREHSSTGQEPINTDNPRAIATARVQDSLRGAEARNKIRKLYNVGTQVRTRTETDIFKKGSEAKWNRQVHTIVEKNGVNFKIDGDEKVYRAWELLPVGKVQRPPEREVVPKETKVPANIRKLREEVEPANVVEAPRTRGRKKEEPKPVPKPKVQPKTYFIKSIDGHIFKGKKLVLLVTWADTPPEINALYREQPAENYFTKDTINPIFQDYIDKVEKKNKKEATKLNDYIA